MAKLNFSWIIQDELSGHQAPVNIDDLKWLKKQGIRAMVRLIEKNQAEITGEQIGELGIWDYHEPIPDYGVPTPEQIKGIICFIEKVKQAAKPVSISCRAGIGRTGTILACVLVSKGYNANAAIKEVRSKRPHSLETPGQVHAVQAFASLS